MPDPTIIEPLLDRFRAPRPRRTASLVVSFFGDAIALCDGSVWLGTLADFLAPLDIDKNALRVSMHRLARDGWLASRREGRKAYYSLTPTGDNVFREAADRIYGPVTAPETGRIETAILTETTDRSGVRQTYQKEGWGALAPNVLVRPAGEAATNAQAEAIHLISSPDPETLRRMVAAAWPIGDLAGQIDAFINLFQPIDQALFTEAELPPGDCLLLRVLLIHEYRRILLKLPFLPHVFFPEGWRGAQARAMAASIYAHVLPASEEWLDEHDATHTGNLPAAEDRLYRRFQK